DSACAPHLPAPPRVHLLREPADSKRRSVMPRVENCNSQLGRPPAVNADPPPARLPTEGAAFSASPAVAGSAPALALAAQLASISIRSSTAVVTLAAESGAYSEAFSTNCCQKRLALRIACSSYHSFSPRLGFDGSSSPNGELYPLVAAIRRRC